MNNLIPHAHRCLRNSFGLMLLTLVATGLWMTPSASAQPVLGDLFEDDSDRLRISPPGGGGSQAYAEDWLEDLQRQWENSKTHLERNKHMREDLQRRLSRYQTARREIRHKLGASALSPENVRPALERLEMRWLDDALALHGKRGRMVALSKAIAELGDQPVEANPELKIMEAELAGQLNLQKEALEHWRLLHESGAASVSEVHDAELQGSDIKIRLARVHEQMKKKQPSEGVRQLNEQLRVLGVDIAELESRQQFIDAFTAEIYDKATTYDDYARIEREIADAQEALRVSQQSIQRHEQSRLSLEMEIKTLEKKIKAFEQKRKADDGQEKVERER